MWSIIRKLPESPVMVISLFIPMTFLPLTVSATASILQGSPAFWNFVHLRDKFIAGILSLIYLYGIFRVIGIAQPELDNVILARLYLQPVARGPEIRNAKQVAVGIARDLIIEQRRAVSGYVVYLPALALHGELLVLVDADYERKILLPQFVVYLVGDLLDRVGPRGDIDRAFIVRAVLADADYKRGVCAVYSDPALVKGFPRHFRIPGGAFRTGVCR